MRALHQTELCHYKNLKQSRYHVFSDIILRFRDQNEGKKKKKGTTPSNSMTLEFKMHHVKYVMQCC